LARERREPRPPEREDDDVEAVERPADGRVRGDVHGGGSGGVRDAGSQQPGRSGCERGWCLGDSRWRAVGLLFILVVYFAPAGVTGFASGRRLFIRRRETP